MRIGSGSAGSAAAFGLVFAFGFGQQVVAVHAGDEVDRDAFGADRFAFAVVRAGAEAFVFHLLDHRLGAAPALGLALGQEAEVGDLGGGEEMGGGVGAGG